MSLTALTLRYACDQTSRAPLEPADSLTGSNVYLGNPLEVQAAMFSGLPSERTLIMDLAATVTKFTILMRKVDQQGEFICQKEVPTSLTPTPIFDGSLQYEDWMAATNQHVKFQFSVMDMNVAVPSCGRLEYYAGISALTSAGPVLVGFFQGYIVDDGVTVWLVGVTSTGAPVLYFRLVDAYITTPTSLEFINGDMVSHDTIVKVIIDESGSEWQVFKPATKMTNVDAGIIKLADGSAHLERTLGL